MKCKQLLLVFLWPLITNTIIAQVTVGYENGIKQISQVEIKEIVGFLASDSIKGRDAITIENLAAANFIAEKFKIYGLKPFGIIERQPKIKDDSEEVQENELEVSNPYFQKFNLQFSKLDTIQTFGIVKENGESTISTFYKYGVDFLVNYKSAVNLQCALPMVFAGYGLTKEKDYNDYIDSSGNEIDVKGKAVIVLEGFPQDMQSNGKFNNSKNAELKNILRKADGAANKGAAALIVIANPLKSEPPINIKYSKNIAAYKLEHPSLPELNETSIPIIYINSKITSKIFADSRVQLNEVVKKINTTLKGNCFSLKNEKVQLDLRFITHNQVIENVVGLVEGTDSILKKEVIVVGAHFDHVGLGHHGTMHKSDEGKIHNGADDNASGTSAMMQLAKAFSKNRSKRSVLFIAFNAEEYGLFGSREYAALNPLLPLENTKAMINLDMIGRNNISELWVGGIFYSMDMKNIVEQANAETKFELFYNTGMLTNASDQSAFLKRKIPAVFFFSGLHDDYHTPADKIDKLNFDKIEKVSKLAYLSAWILGNTNNLPKYKETSLEERTAIVKESIERQKKGMKK